MKTMLWLFDEYEAARSAVSKMLEGEVDERQINAIIDKEAAREVMDVDWSRADVRVTEKVGEQELHGLDQVLAGEEPVRTPDAGDVLAGGELATLLAKTASTPAGGVHGLGPALVDMLVLEETAREFVEGIKAGGTLVLVRVEDRLAADIAASLYDEKDAVSAELVVG